MQYSLYKMLAWFLPSIVIFIVIPIFTRTHPIVAENAGVHARNNIESYLLGDRNLVKSNDRTVM